MTETRKEVEEKFYQQCAELLGVPCTYKEWPFTHRTRWNNRKPGNGRFEGYGLIRMFGLSHIHVCLKKPIKINKVFTSVEETLSFLKKNV